MSIPTRVKEFQQQKRAEIRKRVESEALGEHLQARVRHPDPIIGWEGNPWFTVARNVLLDRLEIWYEKPGEEQMVCHAPLDPPPDIGELLVGLMEWGDEKRTPIETRMARMDAHNDKIMADRNKEIDDELEEAGDRLELAVIQDIQGSRGRLF